MSVTREEACVDGQALSNGTARASGRVIAARREEGKACASRHLCLTATGRPWPRSPDCAATGSSRLASSITPSGRELQAPCRMDTGSEPQERRSRHHRRSWTPQGEVVRTILKAAGAALVFPPPYTVELRPQYHQAGLRRAQRSAPQGRGTNPHSRMTTHRSIPHLHHTMQMSQPLHVSRMNWSKVMML
jgi:hypothetical protein